MALFEIISGRRGLLPNRSWVSCWQRKVLIPVNWCPRSMETATVFSWINHLILHLSHRSCHWKYLIIQSLTQWILMNGWHWGWMEQLLLSLQKLSYLLMITMTEVGAFIIYVDYRLSDGSWKSLRISLIVKFGLSEFSWVLKDDLKSTLVINNNLSENMPNLH